MTLVLLFELKFMALECDTLCLFLQQVMLESWSSHRQANQVGSQESACVCMCVWVCVKGDLSPELYLTSHSPLQHTPCQQVGPYLSPPELRHWALTWPCHYLVPGFVSTLLSTFCVFPDFPFPHYLNRDKNRVYLTPPLLSALFMKEALYILQRKALTVTFHGTFRCTSQHHSDGIKVFSLFAK